MSRQLLSLALVVTQFLSWNASPLFACVGGDGSVCVDFGPESCLCCQHDDTARGHDACDSDACDSNSCDGHDHHGALDGDSRAANHLPDGPTNDGCASDDGASADDCGCVHLRLSQPRSMARGVHLDGASDFAWLSIASPAHLDGTDLLASSSLSFASPALRASSLSSLSTVILRR